MAERGGGNEGDKDGTSNSLFPIVIKLWGIDTTRERGLSSFVAKLLGILLRMCRSIAMEL